MAENVFNPDLLEDLARQRVALFLGAGVSNSATTRANGRIKTWQQFLSDASQLAEQDVKEQVADLLNQRDFLLACEILQRALQDQWEELVSKEFGQMADPSPLHEAIVALDQRIILTTNFDKLIEVSWENRLGNATHLPTVISRIDRSIFNIFKSHSTKYLVKIHGTVDDVQSLVFSRSEYIRLAFGNSEYASFLETLLLNYTFLFIGFSMEDPAITSLMELYALRYEKARPHYIFSAHGVPSNIVEINRRLRKLQIIQYDTSDNHSQLPVLINELSLAAEARRREIFAAFLAKSEK